MTEPDEALLWARKTGLPIYLHHTLAHAYRAGAAASAERIKALEARVAAFEWALTPSGDTKSAYIGEFKQAVEDENVIIIEWTVVKEIMEAIRKFALLKEADQ